MAESILSDLAVGLISKVGSLLLDEIVLWWGVKDELKKFKRTVDTIKAVLLDAEEKSSHNHQVKQWLGMLSEAMYDADDLLDEFSYEALHQQLMGGSGTSKKVRRFFSSSNQFAFGLKMAHKVKALRERLDEIAANRRFHLEERSYVERRFVSQPTHSSLPQVVIGREHDKEKIVQFLLSSDCAENVSAVSVVGFGGLGKTTLSQLVYNDDTVKNHFELKMWVCVSDNFDVLLLVKNMLESASRQAPSSTQMDLLKDQLQEKINGKRYLLVLDDVWNEDVNKWTSFTDLIAGGSKGSKIVITTRRRTVAELSRAVYIHELGGLSENESWSLFKKVAFNQRHLLNSSLEAMGKQIVAKCCGVPLAIKTIGGVLYSKDPDTEWESFKDNELSKIDVYNDEILPILKLSYNHLPSQYKHCFACCSLYPKDYKISVDELIQIWKSLGYVKPTKVNECLHDVGLEYFMDLFRLSFFQDVEKDDFGNIKYCKMHDLLHDLAVLVAGDNFFLSSSHQMTSVKGKTQNMSFCGYDLRHASTLLRMKKIRTILTLNIHSSRILEESELDAIFCNLRRLRVLDLSFLGTSALPNSICKLKSLRYLDLSHNNYIEQLPNSVTDLHNLQVLKLQWCNNLGKWPSNITKLINLTDLDIRGCSNLKYMPSGIGKLTRLERLPEFLIAKDQSTSKYGGGLNELHSLNNLTGELTIKNLTCTKIGALAEVNLSSKLENLTLDLGEYDYSQTDVGIEEKGMEALRPHPNLKVLNVWKYRGVKLPNWLPFITNLAHVRIEYCRSLQRLPPFDHLPRLKTLCLCGLTMLEYIDVENQGRSSPFFPSLAHLKLQNCPNLKGFQRQSSSSSSSEELPHFPCLSQLEITFCDNLIHLPLFPELENGDFNVIMELTVSDGLRELHMKSYGGAKPPSWLPFITNLANVSIENCGSLRRLPPFDHLPHLKRLRISSLPILQLIDVENRGGFFPSLTKLTLLKCLCLKGLLSLSKQELPSFPCLSSLSISGCPNLTHLPLSPELEHLEWNGMKSLKEILKMPTNSAFTLSKLQELWISNMEDCKENELNDGMLWQSLEALRSVSFVKMENLVSLPKGLQYAITLQSLYIDSCPSLECIPEWMPNLVALQDLTIIFSQQLEERCNNNSAEDWPKISHIPNVEIGWKQIRKDGCYQL